MRENFTFLFHRDSQSVFIYDIRPKNPSLNLAVWMPPDYHRTPPEIEMAGPFGN